MGARVQVVRLQREVDEALEGHVPHEVYHASTQAESARQKRQLDSRIRIIRYLLSIYRCKLTFVIRKKIL